MKISLKEILLYIGAGIYIATVTILFVVLKRHGDLLLSWWWIIAAVFIDAFREACTKSDRYYLNQADLRLKQRDYREEGGALRND